MINKSAKIFLFALLIAVAGGILSVAVILFISYQAVGRARWEQLPSPPEPAVAIVQLGVVRGHSGAIYRCNLDQLACVPVELAPGEIVVAECEQLDPTDPGLRGPRSAKGQLIAACQAEIMSEIVITQTMLLYDDNSLWLGEAGGTTLPMYGAEFFLALIFCVGAVPVFFASLAVLRARMKQIEAQLPGIKD